MPVFEKTAGGEVLLRGINERVSVGDRVDVNEGFADYLEERGDFTAVDVTTVEYDEVDDAGGGESETPDEDVHEEDGPPDPVTFDIADTIEAGKCPWCDEYEGENVGQHASSAHPDKWTAYKEG